jgi:cytosine/adenosine deaminase-related metal-dependent hydrolase
MSESNVTVAGGPRRGLAPALGHFDGKGRTLITQAIVVTGASLGELRADILIDGDKITEIAPSISLDDAQIIDGSDYIVSPGFIDTHRHLWQTAYKGLSYDFTLMEYFQRLYYAYAPKFRPEDTYSTTYLGRLAALDAGITTVLDWAHNINTPEIADAGIQALRDTGARSVFGHGWAWDRLTDLERNRHRAADAAFARRTREILPDDTALVSSCFCGQELGFFASLEACQADFRTARDLGMRITVHYASLGADGGHSPTIQALHEAGLMGPDTTYVHLTGANDHEFKLIADSGGTASVAAQIECHMPSFPPPPIGRLMLAGIRPSLSADTVMAASDDFFSQMRAAYESERVIANNKYQARPSGISIKVRDVFEFATFQGARALAMDRRLGTIEPGKQADLLFVRTDSLNMLPLNDPIAALVFHANVGDIDTVLVAGRALKRGGRLVADVSQARNQIEETVEHLYWRNASEIPTEAQKPHPSTMPLCMCGAN